MKQLHFSGLIIALLLCLSGCATALPQQEDLAPPILSSVLLVNTGEDLQRADNLPVTFVRDESEIAIGMTREEVEAQTGPVLFYDRAPVTAEITFYKYDGIDVAYRDGVAGAIRLQGGSRWTTNAGIGMGSSSREELLNAYGFDLLRAAPNGVHTLTYQISGDSATAVTWQEYSEGDPFENFYLSINVTQSGVVYDLVLRDRAYVDNIFRSTEFCSPQTPARLVL